MVTVNRMPALARLAAIAGIVVCLAGWTPVCADTDQDIKDGIQLYRDGKYSEALGKFQNAVSTNPPADAKNQCHFWLGVVYEALGRGDESIAELEALREVSDYRWPEVLNKLAVRYRAKGATAMSDSLIQELIERRKTATNHADQHRADLLIGDCLTLKGDFLGALDQYTLMRPLCPEDDQNILYHIAGSAYDAQKYDKAIEAYKEHMATYPTSGRFAEVAFKIVEVYRDAKRYQDASDHLARLATDHPELRTRALISQAEICAEGLHDTETSNRLAQRVVDESTDPYMVYIAKYRLATNDLWFTRDAKAARTRLLAIVDLYPKDNLAVEMASEIAWSYYSEGDYVKAAQLYAEALKKYPCPVPSWDSFIRFMVGRSYMEAHDHAGARKAWASLAAAHPDDGWTEIAKKEQAGWKD